MERKHVLCSIPILEIRPFMGAPVGRFIEIRAEHSSGFTRLAFETRVTG